MSVLKSNTICLVSLEVKRCLCDKFCILSVLIDLMFIVMMNSFSWHFVDGCDGGILEEIGIGVGIRSGGKDGQLIFA